MTPSTPDIVVDTARAAIRAEAAAVALVADQLDDSFSEAASWLRYCRGKVVLTGAGTSASVAQRSAHLFAVCGTPAFAMEAADALHGTMGALTRDDILIAMSKGGGSAEVNAFAALARERHVRVITLCSTSDAELTRHADLAIHIPAHDAGDPGGFVAMGSTLAYSAWLDAMALVLMRSRQYAWADVLATHPRGAVGHIRTAPAPLDPLDIRQRALRRRHNFACAL